MGRASDWRAENDRLLDAAEAADALREAQERYDELLERDQCYVLEGPFRRTNYQHPIVGGKWVTDWIDDVMSELREGRTVRITIEEIT